MDILEDSIRIHQLAVQKPRGKEFHTDRVGMRAISLSGTKTRM
jgi:hypothetical protein